MATATFVEQPQTLFGGGTIPVRDRGWLTCVHGTTWPAENFVTRSEFFDRESFKQKCFLNHQRRFPECDCTLSESGS